MDATQITPLIRMMERSLIVLGGILAVYLGYKLFVLGIDKTQGSASAFNMVELKNFGPGLFFAALGAIILVTSMRAAIRVEPVSSVKPKAETDSLTIKSGLKGQPQKSPATFFGMEDPNRISNQWDETSFFLETRELIEHLEKNESGDNIRPLMEGLKKKLNSITMSQEEYTRYQQLGEKIPLDVKEQQELKNLEKKLFPRQ